MEGDSVLDGVVELILGERKLITAPFKFINLKYFQKKLEIAQAKPKKKERQDAVKDVVTS